MCELSQFSYAEGSIVWVKLGSCWWPGEVTNVDSLPEEILQNLKKKPFTAVKFFDEDKYEYVRNLNNICLYNNRRKDEFIKKGLDMARAKAKEGSTVMKKFPSDVVTAECRTGGDPNILTSDTFAPRERVNYRDIFGESPGKKKLSKKSTSPNKSFSARKPGKSPSNGQSKSWKDLEIPSPERVVPKITHRRFISESDHEVRIRQQPSTPPKEEAKSPNSNYKCHICGFTSSRLNVIVLHNKAHQSESTLAGTKQQTPGKKKRTPVGKPPPASSVSKQRNKSSEVKDTSSRAKKNILNDSEKKSGLDETVGEKSNSSLRKKGKTNAKKKRETEVRESLLADWDEEDEEEEEKEIENLKMVLGSSRKQEMENMNETIDETITPSKEPDANETSIIESPKSPEKVSEKPAEVQDLELEFKSIMEETAVPVMPNVPAINSSTPIEEESSKEDVEGKPENEVKDDERARADDEMTAIMEAKEKTLGGESNEIFESPSSNVIEPECKRDGHPPGDASSEELVGTPLPSTVPQQESQISAAKMEIDTTVIPPSSHVSSAVVTTSNTGSENVSSSLNVSQEAYGILPITTDSQKTEMNANVTMSIPASNTVEGITTRTLVSAASSEETTETATYVLVTIDDSGALQHIDNMNTALLALDGQQEDGPRTLYIDSSQLGTQATDLENIFLAIDTRGDMATQMVELTNRTSDQAEGQGQSFAAAAAASAAKAKSAQDILAVALANTQMFQGDGSYVALNPAASAVTVTSSRTAQAPVMTPRVVDPCRSNAVPSTPTTISSTPLMPDIGGHIGEVQRPVNLPPPIIETQQYHPQLPPHAQTLSTIPSVIHTQNQTTVVTLPTSLPHLNSDDSASRLETSAMSNMLTLPSLMPSTYAPVGVGNGQTGATLALISGANVVMDQVTQALPKVGTDSVVATSRDHVAEKRKLECDVRESKQMKVDENGGS
ncbi:uncharacterized protein LOC124167210 [Ischnura elegans]|uniref:uncharacterized protein LOC124167210 n=1 Tax=Ischnura elegans TaxID=197161 RepID=UPI001ED8A3A7|nr:uncharacterized protein LOC124167210 [Ischnura elegans]